MTIKHYEKIVNNIPGYGFPDRHRFITNMNIKPFLVHQSQRRTCLFLAGSKMVASAAPEFEPDPASMTSG